MKKKIVFLLTLLLTLTLAGAALANTEDRMKDMVQTYLDENGQLQKPKEPNAYKFETLILDMVYMMDNCLPFEVEREKEFAPVKNALGTDSVESARELLKKNGIAI